MFNAICLQTVNVDFVTITALWWRKKKMPSVSDCSTYYHFNQIPVNKPATGSQTRRENVQWIELQLKLQVFCKLCYYRLQNETSKLEKRGLFVKMVYIIDFFSLSVEQRKIKQEYTTRSSLLLS